MLEEMFKIWFPSLGLSHIIMIALISAVSASIGAMFIVWPLISTSLGDARKKE